MIIKPVEQNSTLAEYNYIQDHSISHGLIYTITMVEMEVKVNMIPEYKTNLEIHFRLHLSRIIDI